MHIKKVIFCFMLLVANGIVPAEIRKEKLEHELSERTYNKTLISKVALASTTFALATTIAFFINTLWIHKCQRDCGRNVLKSYQALFVFVHYLEKYALPTAILSNLYHFYNTHRITYLENTLKQLQAEA